MIKIPIILCIPLLAFFQIPAPSKVEKIPGTDSIIVHVLDSMSIVAKGHAQSGDYGTYKSQLNEILLLAEEHDVERFIIRANTQLGVATLKLGEYEEALKYYDRAITLMKDKKTYRREKSVALLNLSNVYMNIGSFPEASDAAKEAIQLAKGLDLEPIIQAGSYNTIAEAYVDVQVYDSALLYYNKTKDLGEMLQQPYLKIVAFINIADCYVEMKQYESALIASERGLSLHDSTTSTENKTWNYLAQSLALSGLKRFEESIDYARQAEDLAHTFGYASALTHSYQQQADAYEALENYELANEANKAFIETREAFFATLTKTQRRKAEQELQRKQTKITDQEDSITTLLADRQMLIWVSGALVICLGGLLFLSRQRKKTMENSFQIIQKEKSILKNENASLQTRLTQLAEKNAPASYASSSLSEEERRSLMDQILSFMDDERPYLNPDINQLEVAKALKVSVHTFSEVLNSCFKMNFNSFMNVYRVDEVKKLIEDPQYSTYKIMAIGFEAGFKSKTSFNRVFKSIVGQTPSEYREKSVTK